MKVVYLKRLFVKDCAEKCEFIGFEVLTAVVMNRRIFWDITPCSPLEIN
jgi:hypothetical protein